MSAGKQRPWFQTAQHRLQASAAISAWNARQRAHGVKCGARRKHDGQPCQQYAMENGRCYYHGGRVGKGKDWHKPRWPKKSAPDAAQRLARKIQDLEKAARRRERRLARMSPEQRAEYQAWLRTHQPGDAGARATRRRELEQNKEARALLSRDRAPSETLLADPKYRAIIDRLAELRALMAAKNDPPSSPIANLGVFE